ncbi:MAG: hypothetical protein CUN53_14265 [Phototrophicales bacterium]|nr:MAG: hypothetical protein CUN53_14265 [Phototrophicales bacterium]
MPQKNIKRSIAMSEEMHALLTQIAAKRGREVKENDVIREAIRQYLDEQADVVGSRRHFQKSLQTRLDQMESTLVFQMQVLTYLLAAVLGDESGAAIDDAIVTARRDGEALLKQIAAVRDLKGSG